MTVSILLFLPIVAALVVLLFKNEAAKYVALGFSVAELVIAGIFLSRFVPDATTQFTVNLPWLPRAGIPVTRIFMRAAVRTIKIQRKAFPPKR